HPHARQSPPSADVAIRRIARPLAALVDPMNPARTSPAPTLHRGEPDYFVCVGRQQKRTQCDQSAIRAEDTEEWVEQYYARIQLQPGYLRAVRRYLNEELAAESERAAAEAAL